MSLCAHPLILTLLLIIRGGQYCDSKPDRCIATRWLDWASHVTDRVIRVSDALVVPTQDTTTTTTTTTAAAILANYRDR